MPDLRENLADYAHRAWSGWMVHLFEQTTLNPDESAVIPAGLVDRWSRQIRTPYEDLSEKEKDSDRKEADRMLEIMGFKLPIQTGPHPECPWCGGYGSIPDIGIEAVDDGHGNPEPVQVQIEVSCTCSSMIFDDEWKPLSDIIKLAVEWRKGYNAGLAAGHAVAERGAPDLTTEDDELTF